MKVVYCYDCNQKLYNDEIALNLKLLGKYIGKFRCGCCLSTTLGCDRGELVNWMNYYKNSGCILFQAIYTE